MPFEPLGVSDKSAFVAAAVAASVLLVGPDRSAAVAASFVAAAV